MCIIGLRFLNPEIGGSCLVVRSDREVGLDESSEVVDCYRAWTLMLSGDGLVDL